MAGKIEVNCKIKLKLQNGKTSDALVLTVGPKTVYRVTYDGWTNIYDEYVAPEDCIVVTTGEAASNSTKIANGDKLKVKWVDGSSYIGTVLRSATAVACVRPDAYPEEYKVWVTTNELAGDYQLANNEAFTDVIEIGKQITVKLMNGRRVKANVIERGPTPVIKMTYDGWSKVYDEYVDLGQCTYASSGDEVTDIGKVKKNDKLKVKWLDGGVYTGTVLETATAAAKVQPEGFPKEYKIWITENDVVKENGSEQKGSKSSGVAIEVGSQIKVSLVNGTGEIKATVSAKGPTPVLKVTYDGWSKVYDEYVDLSQCTYASNGERVTDIEKVKKNDKLKVKWLDGSVYAGTVLDKSTAVARVQPEGYPKEYQIWITENEVAGGTDSQQSSSASKSTGNVLEDAMQKAMADITQLVSDTQQQSLEVKRSDEIPKRKIPGTPSPKHKDNSKWNKFLSKTLIPKANLDRLVKKSEQLKKPAWSGKKMNANEFDVGIGASKEDMDFAEIVATALHTRGIKVTVDQDYLHNSRTFLLIYSDSVNMDENVIRHLTRAAERFNMGETIIIALVRPGCPEEVIDQIPDRVAYSLSNVVFFNHDWFGEPAEMARRKNIADLAAMISNNVNETHNYDLTGTWLCQAVVTSTVTSYSATRDFTLLLKQQGNKITGRTIDNFKIEGEVQKSILKLRITYRGKYDQNIDLWEEEDYFFIAEVAAIIHNQGYRLEGEYFEETDAGKESSSGASKFDASNGPFSATLEKQCLSGYYNAHWYRKTEYEETFAIIHRGGNELIAEFPNQFGSLNVAFIDLVTNTIQLNSCGNRNMTRTIIGKLTKDTEQAASFQCLSYGCEFGITGDPEPIALTRDPIHIWKMVSENDDDVLKKMHKAVSTRLQGMPFTPGSYKPLADDEFPVVVFCTEHEKEKALKLKSDLENIQEIKPVSIKASDWQKSRTIVLLLSQFTQTDEGLIEFIEQAAEQEIPIFNIGLDSWFDIFGPNNWKNQELRLKLMNALARLNQTPANTLDPNHNNFRGLVKGIRKRIEAPKFNILGLFGVEVMGSDPPEKISKYSDLEDETIQMIKRPLIMYLYVDQSTNKLMMGTDYIVQGLTGEIDPETFTLTMKNDAGSYELRINADMDKLYGKYWSKRANKEYTILATKAESGVSGFYAMGAQQTPTGIVQLGKRTADIVFGGYMLPAMISNNKIIFNAPYPAQKNILITYAAQILLKPEGNYLYGFSYQSQSTTPRTAFDAKQYAGGHQKILKNKKKDDERAEKWLLDIINEFWRCSKEGDYEGFLKISKEDMGATFGKEAFDKMVVDNRRSMGKYIKNSAVYLGKKAQVTMGKPIGETRYDFKFDFEKLKKIEYYLTIIDETKKLNGIMSYEEEAELMHQSQYDVMISYRSWDARWIDLLQAFLESNGYTVWRDRRMDVGVNWSEDITKAVRRAGCVLAAISENYLTSVLCTKEVRMANDIAKPVIPLILPETCPKKNPTEKMVSSSYKEKHLPITIANELSDVTWVDFRPLADLNSPDPNDVESFGKKYNVCLQSLLRTLEELMNHRRVVNMQGDWNLVIKRHEGEEKIKLSILATLGSEVEGVMTSDKHDDADIPLDKNVSLCTGSNMHIAGTYKGKAKALSYILDCKIAADGNSFQGVCRVYKTPWEHPVGQQVNPLVLGLTHYSTTNDCTLYPVKGTRVKPLDGMDFNSATEEFILDVDRAYDILKNAFKDIKREALEQSIISYKEAFEKYDVDGSHELDMDELELALRVANMNCSKAEKTRIMQELDQDDSGTVDFYEFLEYIAKIKESKVKGNTPAAQVVKKGFVSRVCVLQ